MEEFKNLQETKLTSQPIFDGDVLHIYKDTVRLPNGKTSTREYTVHHGAVCILPLLENGDVLLERQFRYAMGEVLTEIPPGSSTTSARTRGRPRCGSCARKRARSQASSSRSARFTPPARIRPRSSRCSWHAG